MVVDDVDGLGTFWIWLGVDVSAYACGEREGDGVIVTVWYD